MTRSEIELQVRKDYEAMPKYIRTPYIKGYDENGDTVELTFDAPGILVRVDKASDDELTRWMDDWLDPFWPVTPIERTPEMETAHGWEMYGTSYRYPSGERELTEYTPVNPLKGLLRSLVP